MHGRRFAMALALCAAAGGRALAQSHEMTMHHGVPSRVLAGRRVGPYVASVWLEGDVGAGAVYVMLDPAEGLAFTPPSAVRVALAPTSGRLAERVVDARPAGARGDPGGRYVATVTFDRPERWNLRVIVDGPAGGGELGSQVEAVSNASLGPLGVFLSTAPFVLVALVYGRSWLARRRARPTLSRAPRLTRPPLD